MKKIFNIINMVLIFCIISFLVSGFYKYFTWEFDVNDSFQAAVTGEQNFEKKDFKAQSHYENVAKRDLFGTQKNQKHEKKSPVEPEKKPLPEITITDLDLELIGTITGTGSEPLAVITKKGNKKQAVYSIGDTVDKAVIKSILRQRVILLVDGKQETLLMKKSKTKASSRSADTNKISNSDTKDAFSDNIILTREEVDKFAEDLINLRKKVRIRPHFYKNKMDGFRVTGIKKDSVFYQKLGLKNGDIVTDVNGENLRTMKDAMGFYKTFSQLGDNSVTDIGIKRKGSMGKIKYTIE